ncbi:MAG: DinB family protein [Candidatus Acidiferrum sp.]
MAPALDFLIVNLANTQAEFLCAAEAVAAEEWNTMPCEGRWSAAELVAHLMMVERAVIEKATRVTQKPPKRVGLLKRIHIPMMLVEWRVIRRKSPLPLAPELLRGREEMLAELRKVRRRSRAFLEETRGRDLRDYCWKHPALGTLNIYEWMRFISAHEVRHTKQMREIAASLPNVIERLQK